MKEEYGDEYQTTFNSNKLIQYLDYKMGAIDGDSKSRRSLGNIYAIYSITHFYSEDFIEDPETYKLFPGYEFTKLFYFCRSLYGGEKLQNHALNSRVNGEFINKFPDEVEPIVIDNGKYSLHINYLYSNGKDTSKAINRIIEKYIEILIEKDSTLMRTIEELSIIKDTVVKKEKIKEMLNSKTEARVFEIISYAVLKNHYRGISIIIGDNMESLRTEYLTLYKTGRTNANDGGIDFVMRPLGRFFQVSEVGSYNKYFLDMDKVLHFPITFVIKTEKAVKEIQDDFDFYIHKKSGGMKTLEERYKSAIEEIITINELRVWINFMSAEHVDNILKDIEVYYKYEMNCGSQFFLD